MSWLRRQLDSFDKELFETRYDSVKYWKVEELHSIYVRRDRSWTTKIKVVISNYERVKELLSND